jgi:hypothetical protein
MFTRYLGGGIGHKVTEDHDIQSTRIIYKRAHEKETETLAETQEGVDADHTVDHTEPLDERDERDSEGVDSDEELERDYNYGDSAMEDSDACSDADQGLGSTDSESDHDEETFEDYD